MTKVMIWHFWSFLWRHIWRFDILEKFLMFLDPLLTSPMLWRQKRHGRYVVTSYMKIWHFGEIPYVILPLVDQKRSIITELRHTLKWHMTSHTHRYDEMRFLWYVYDMNWPGNRWLGLTTETRKGGHGPAVPLPPGSWSVDLCCNIILLIPLPSLAVTAT